MPLGKIAVLTPYASSDYLGGVEVFNRQLTRALGGVEVFADREGHRSDPRWNMEAIGMAQPYRAFRVARSFLEKHRTQPFDLAISNGLSGWPLSLRHLDIPLIQVYHFTMAGLARQALDLRGDRLTTRTVGGFFDALAGRGKHVVAVSPSVLHEVERFYQLTGRVIFNAVDANLFKRDDRTRARAQLGLPPDETIGLFVGRAEYAKGFDLFLEVARSLRKILFLFVGRSSLTEPNVRVFENVPHAQMPLFYASADFLFLPSRYEGFPLTPLEAVACGLPIVVSEAAYSMAGDPATVGYVARRLRAPDFVKGIETVLERGSPVDPRQTIAAYSFEVFRDKWRQLVGMVLEREAT